jgi:hypothetical protein
MIGSIGRFSEMVGSARAGPDMVSMVVSLRATDIGRL